MAAVRAHKESAHITVASSGVVQDADLTHKVSGMGIVFDVADGFRTNVMCLFSVWISAGRCARAVRVIEVISCVSKGVHFESSQMLPWDFGEEPIDNKTAFYTALRMKYENNFRVLVVKKCLFD